MSVVKTLKLQNSHTIPMLGLGTWKSMDHEVVKAVKHAIEIGYRHIDTAFVYGNEKEVGEGIQAAIDEGTVERKDLFITTKLWNTFHRKDLVIPAIKESLSNLNLEYIDLYLIHWPMAYQEGGGIFPKDDQGQFIFSTASFLETWMEMENAVDMGLIKSLGVSNFNSKQTQKIMDTSRILPQMVQVECHPYFPNTQLLNFCKKNGIAFTAYSPFGSPQRAWKKEGEPIVIEEEKVKALAAKHQKTPSQVVLRWNHQRGVIVIPKSVTPSRIKENMDIFDFELTDEDMKIMESFHVDRRVPLNWGPHLHPDFPFHEPY